MCNLLKKVLHSVQKIGAFRNRDKHSITLYIRGIRQIYGTAHFPCVRFPVLDYSQTSKDIFETILLSGGGHSIVKNTGGGGWLDSLGSGIFVGKRYFGVLQKY